MSSHISKDVFLAGLKCRTQGWLAHRAAREAIGPGLEWRFHIGQEVGRLARGQLGDGVGLPIGPTATALEATTSRLGDPGSAMLYEASFEWQGCIARADALRRHGNGWDLVEVKSGKAPEDGEVDADYIDDAAYTAMVALGAGLSVQRCFLMLIRRDLRLGDGLPVLEEVEVTATVLARAAEFTAGAGLLSAAILSETRPPAVLIFECRDCPFFATECIGVGVSDPLFILPRISQKKFDALRGYERISALPDGSALTDSQQRVARVIRSGNPEADRDGLALLDQVVWPAHYLDFEAVMPALPWFPDTAPYETIPFQYSLHLAEAPGWVTGHREFLAPMAGDWRRELAETLLADLGSAGSIVSYSGYEKRMLNYLAQVFPDLSHGFTAAVARLFDLEKVVNKGYCHPGFLGRTSIKNVLPVMVPSLSYASLRISGGEDALGTFGLMRLGKRTAGQHGELRAALLEYCKRDTEAMVAVHLALLSLKRQE